MTLPNRGTMSQNTVLRLEHYPTQNHLDALEEEIREEEFGFEHDDAFHFNDILQVVGDHVILKYGADGISRILGID